MQLVKLYLTRPQREIFLPKKESKYTIVPKGRRFGATKGMQIASVLWALQEDKPFLWVDTINGNIDRYFERYFYPTLKENKIEHKWNQQKRQLNIANCIIDFRSADNPESIEGFGYRKIFLNEAGIILKNNYLYTNSILPMLIDFPESQLYALGTPKGRYKKDGNEHLFYTLNKRALEDTTGTYRSLQYSSYDNRFLNKQDVLELEKEMGAMDASMIRQEIYGEFIESEGARPFAHNYDKTKHEGNVLFNPNLPIYVSMDFNIDPFGFIFSHIWSDKDGYHCHTFDEAVITNGNIQMAIELIKERYGRYVHNMFFTGDAMGNQRDIAQRDHASHYQLIRRGLNIRSGQIQIPANPRHTNSRVDVNYVLYHFPDFKINPDKCPNLARDMKIVQVDAFGKILKQNRSNIAQQADFLDCLRYMCNTFLSKWIRRHQKLKK